MVHPHFINGEVFYLVQPQHIGTKWSQQNKHFRSSLWTAQGELVSAGLPKFTNFGENPEHFPVPTSLKNCQVVTKLDGSSLIISRYKGEFIIRTRGTVDATKMDNGHEIVLFKEKYPVLFDPKSNETWEASYVCEWVSPINQIVLKYPEPELYLIGAINHEDYSLVGQGHLDNMAALLKLKRPIYYEFDSITDLISSIEKWENLEGVCLYSNNGQTIHKIKSAWYLLGHRLKSELSSIDKIIDLWFVIGKPDYQGFVEYIQSHFDFEIFENSRGYISKIIDGWKETERIIAHMDEFILPLKTKTRKEAAIAIQSAYSITNRAGMLFSKLDGKSLTAEQEKKLLYQVLKS